MPDQHPTVKTAAALPLTGRKILVTRAVHQASALAQKLELAGAEVIELPMIEILPPKSWEEFDRAFYQAQKYDWILFAGVNAVEFTAARLEQTGQLAAVKSQLKAAAVGESTFEAVRAAGFAAAFHPGQFSGAALVQQFPGYPDLSGVKMIWPRTNIGSSYAAEELRKAGARIDIVVCYRTAPPANKEEVSKKLASLLLNNGVNVITLNSAQTARNFYELLKLGLDSLETTSGGSSRLQALLAPVTIASIGPETTASARQLLGRVDIEAETHSIAGLVTELTRCLGSPPPSTDIIYCDDHN